MGGLAFSAGEDPLYTPRMSKDVYQSVKSRCQGLLLKLFFCVASPIEGPSKQDHGDIDVLLALPKIQYATHEETLAEISETLRAERIIQSTGNQCVATMAIAWPTSPDQGTQQSRAKHIQVDVRVCPTLEEWHWMMFAKSHGDISNIVGTMIRPYGLTISDSAMWLRIPEVEEHDKKKARVFLTSEPSEVLAFLGLPIGEYWDRPFDGLQDMYEYAAQCRLMHVRPIDHKSDTDSTATYVQKLKANDRRRMAQRPAFRKWIEEFIPQCRQQGRFSEMKMTRDDITREAFARFHVEAEFNARRDAFALEKQRDYIWNHTIKENIPELQSRDPSAILYRSCLVKAMKRIILEGDQRYGIVPEDSLTDTKGRFLMNKVLDFIRNKQEEVGEAAMERQRSQYREHMLSKSQKKAGCLDAEH